MGSELVRRLHERGDTVLNFDLLTYAADKRNLKDIWESPRHIFFNGDINDYRKVESVAFDFEPDVIVHMAAESHVDRSIVCGQDFARTNVFGTSVMLQVAQDLGCRMVYQSTDEVYGDMETENHTVSRIDDSLNPSSPYSASKSSGDLFCMAAKRTYGTDVVIVRSTNNFGPYQHPEKFIPKAITMLLQGKKFPLFGDGLNVREWTRVEDNADAIILVMEKGEEFVYNVGSGERYTALQVLKMIGDRLCLKEEKFWEFVRDRAGHDKRYSLDSTKIRELGWVPEKNFELALSDTVEWYMSHDDWWKEKLEEIGPWEQHKL